MKMLWFFRARGDLLDKNENASQFLPFNLAVVVYGTVQDRIFLQYKEWNSHLTLEAKQVPACLQPA